MCFSSTLYFYFYFLLNEWYGIRKLSSLDNYFLLRLSFLLFILIYLFIFQEIDLLSQFQHENIVQYHGTAKVLFSVFHTIFCLSVAFGVCFLIYIIDIFCYWVYRIMLYQGFLSFVKFPIIYYIYFISGADLCFLLQLMCFMHCF